MNSHKSIEESLLHKIWSKKEFLNELILPNGESITVQNPGNYNENSVGPDFKNARIRIGSLTFVGDIEIDPDYNDWKNHGHNINRHYNKVVLHICFTNKQKNEYVYTNDGRKIYSLSIKDNIALDNLKFNIKVGNSKKELKIYSLKCSSNIGFIDHEIKRKYILKLGIERFKNKSERIYKRLKELKYVHDLNLKEPVIRFELTEEFNNKNFLHKDFNEKSFWQQLFYELVFEALGYSRNKEIMLKLAQNVNYYFLSNIVRSESSRLMLESIYFNVSGLIPEENEKIDSSDYLNSLRECWKTISSDYDGKRFDETQWQFLGQRPQNFPTIRIAGGSYIVYSMICYNLISKILEKFEKISSLDVLINSIRSLFIVKATGYWRNHYVFEKPAESKLKFMIGLNRANEIFINVLLPYLFVYYEIFGNKRLSKKVLKIYNEYEQKSNNNVTKHISEGLRFYEYGNKSIYSQGMIELYRKYCTKDRCLDCEIGKMVFK
jgi:hypothetical protein